MTNTKWKPNCWTGNNQLMRRNNGVESWHSSLNRAAARNNLEFYMLVGLPSREVNWQLLILFNLDTPHNIIDNILVKAKLVNLGLRLVHDEKLTRHQRRCYRWCQGMLCQAWEKYGATSMTMRD